MAVFQYSGGVAAAPGYAIERVRFREPLPLREGFAHAERHIKEAGRPLTSFCACGAALARAVHRAGLSRLQRGLRRHAAEKWGLFDGKVNPVARSNVCPEGDPPAEPSFHAFSFTVASADAAPSFVISGSAEAREGGASYRERTIRHGETSPDALREKGSYVLGEMERRLAAFDLSWADTTATQVYTVHDLHPFLADEIVRRGAARSGLTWHYARPPVRELEYEMDCRGVTSEHVA